MVSPLAGTLTKERIDTEKLRKLFWEPDGEAAPVKFGTSGHRGALGRGFCAAHARAIAQAVARIHLEDGVTGPVLCGGDTRLMSHDTARLCAEVLAGNGLHVILPDMPLPTPVFSFEIISGRAAASLNGTASHNPPQDMGLKYNPSHGGPAGSELTGRIEKYANEYLQNPSLIKSLPLEQAREKGLVTAADVVTPYVSALGRMVDFEAIKKAGLKAAIHPLGGSSLAFYRAIKEKYGLDNLHIADETIDPTFYFIPIDHDGKIRMDCSSPWAMSVLLNMRDSFDLCFACDPDSDRHGIVTRDGLMNPNHYLSVCAWYLLRTRTNWPANCGIGKTVVTTDLLNRTGNMLGRKVVETPVGFKWFVPLLSSGTCGFCCEESAGGSFLCLDGKTWSTDKDGPLLCLLAAEMMAKEKASPSELYKRLTAELGAPVYERIDSPADEKVRTRVKSLGKEDVTMTSLGDSPVTEVLTRAPGNDAAIGGLKVVSKDGWFAVRPSGTEDICKLYAESFKGKEHLKCIQDTAQDFLQKLLG